MYICSFNAQGLVTKFLQFKEFLSSSDVDIVCVTETWFNQDISDSEFCTSDYAVFRKDRDISFYSEGTYTSSDRGGVMILVKHSLNPILICDDIEAELCFISITPIPNVTVIIGVCYRPEKDEVSILQKICDGINRIDTTNCILVGDFNFRQINWETLEASSPLANKFLDCVMDNCLSQVVDQPTRHLNLLDLVLVGDPDMVDSCQVKEPFSRSDHNTVWLTMRYPVPKINAAPYNVYLYSKGNYNGFSENIEQNDWSKTFKDKSVSECWDILLNTYHKLLDKHVPFKMVKPGRPHGHPWTRYKSVARAKKKKRKKWIECQKSGLFSDKVLYDESMNEFERTVTAAKIHYENKLVENLHDNPKRFWNYTRHFTRSSSTVNVIEKDNVKYTDDASKAELLNDYFVSVLTRESDELHHSNQDATENRSCLLDIEISAVDVRKKLRNLKMNKASGPDLLHVNVLKNVLDLDVPLAYIFNLSLRSGHIPQDWRDANITPLFKKGSRSSPSNYRPVSLTSQVVKVMERLIQDKLVNFLERNKIISCHQHGFQKKSSCITQLLECLNDWTDSYDKKQSTDVVYLDFSKAFDSVPHKRLIFKLRSIGIRGNVLRWIESFLTNRRQRVILPGGVSSWRPVYSGVPQGSILGPILFLVYVNDIPDQVLSTVKMFADDTKVYREISSKEDCEILQSDLNALGAWANHWLLRFNETKCVVLRIRQAIDFQYSLNGTVLQEDDKQKDLGVIISNDLKPETHINDIIKKANRRVGLIKRCFTHFSPEKIKMLYTTMIRPVLEYGSSIWSPHLKKDINQLEKVQTRCLKISNDTVRLTSLEDRREFQDMCETYKITSNLYNLEPSTFFTPCQNSATRGHDKKLDKKHTRTDTRKYFFSNRVIDTWNKLPQKNVSAPSLDAFKKNMRSTHHAEVDYPEK